MKVGIVWATNVWKSTLFNALIGNRRAIVTAIHGTTRDILRHHVDVPDVWVVEFLDTPWLDTFDDEIPYLSRVIQESDFLFFVLDWTIWFGAKEHVVFDLLLSAWKKSSTCLVVNKLDWSLQKREDPFVSLSEYHAYGFDYVHAVSAKSSLWLDDLWSVLSRHFSDSFVPISDDPIEHLSEDVIPIVFVGKPNAGKSTLMNTLLKEDFALVSDIPWTTLDYNVARLVYWDQEYVLYDTAGIRKKWKIHWLERIAYEKTMSMLRYVRPLVVFLVDWSEGITHRDTTLLGEIIDLHLPLIVCVNKVDLLNKFLRKEKNTQTQVFLKFATYIPIVELSWKTWEWFSRLFDIIKKVWIEYNKYIPTADLNKSIRRSLLDRPPRFPKNKECKISYVTQVDIKAPTFVVFVNNTKRANFSFKRRFENSLRFAYWFVGVPLRVLWKNKSEEHT